MTKKYYINNMFWGWIYGALCIYFIFDYDIKEYKWLLLFIISVIGIILYPVAKFAVETFFLKFTTKEFWNKGLFMNTAGKSGLLAIYGGAVFLMAIPITLVFILGVLIRRLLIK
ncbi:MULTISPECIES: colicin E1 family microcin immunity protein [Proteus]|uniref:colicin E1 family microcin immunity protein n=1 Tax=Proteus TaxID=583 RepID=UPI00288B839E|nr:colicin E1 family microcin immunity protein [Proteus columbae]